MLGRFQPLRFEQRISLFQTQRNGATKQKDKTWANGGTEEFHVSQSVQQWGGRRGAGERQREERVRGHWILISEGTWQVKIHGTVIDAVCRTAFPLFSVLYFFPVPL